MPIWVGSVAIPLCALVATLFVQFYFRFVPDVEQQKKHLSSVAWWVWDVITLGVQVGGVYSLAHSNGPVTRGFVVGTALSVGCLIFCFISIGFRRYILDGLIRKSIDNFGRLLDQSGRHINRTGTIAQATANLVEIAAQHEEALRLIADDPKLSPAIARPLQKLLDGPNDPHAK